MAVFIHPTAEVSPEASIGEGTWIWHQAQVREGARLGANCILGKGVYVDSNVRIGNNVKIQNGCFVYRGATIEDGAFLGPGVILTNDKIPRAINPEGSPKGEGDWLVGSILIRRGASLGAGTIVLPGVWVGVFAMVGAGSVVVKDVPDYGLVVGNPARLIGFVCACGHRLHKHGEEGQLILAVCEDCGAEYRLPLESWEYDGQLGGRD